MRGTTFDMIGMALMAFAVLMTAGVGIAWAYLRETRDGSRTENHEERPVAPPVTSTEEESPFAVLR